MLPLSIVCPGLPVDGRIFRTIGLISRDLCLGVPLGLGCLLPTPSVSLLLTRITTPLIASIVCCSRRMLSTACGRVYIEHGLG
jgi:hypothetical protein